MFEKTRSSFVLKAIYALPILLALGIWGVLTPQGAGPYEPYPSQILRSLIDLTRNGPMFADLVESLKRVALGFSVALVSGWAIGLVAARNVFLNRLIVPFVELFRPIPPIAWIPIAIIWLGIGFRSAALIIFLGSFFPIFSNVYFSTRTLPASHLMGAKSLGARPPQLYKEIIIPGTLSATFLGAKIGLGVGWMCVIAAEMIAADTGLGYAIQINRQLLLTSNVLAYMFVIAVVGLALQGIFNAAEFLFLPWTRQRSSLDRTPVAANSNGPVQRDKLFTSQFPTHGSLVELRGLSHRYAQPGPWVLKDFSLRISAGERVAIVGPSGCGKTTILNLTAGFFRASDSGQVLVDGRPISGAEGSRAVVFQDYSLFPWKTVHQNVGFGMRAAGIDHASTNIAVEQELRQYRIEGLRARYPHELSGGQRQRVALARATILHPKVLLLDEPLGAIDALTRDILLYEIESKLTGHTVVLVTHNLDEAIYLCDRIILLSGPPVHIMSEHTIPFAHPRERPLRSSKVFQNLRETIFAELLTTEHIRRDRREVTNVVY